jgi:geranylgeranyl diphosphate synthase type II
MDAAGIDAYLADCRQLALHEIREIIPKDERYRTILYDLVLDYPLRSAKALRPALCIASCRALGGSLESVLRSAAVLELYHSAFLIHDDVEDGSESRRDAPTLHDLHGVPIAVNVGDAMLALALAPLLDNMRLIGMGKALRILQAVARMARESAEGQALELHWIRTGEWQLTDSDYLRMVYKKTSWYSFMTPVLIGAIVAGASPAQAVALRKFAALLGIAFQIQDDVLNLTAEGDGYGKEIAGDLWEGKRTLLLLHALRSATAAERARATAILGKARPPVRRDGPNMTPAAVQSLLAELHARGELSAAGQHAIEVALYASNSPSAGLKSVADIAFLQILLDRYGSIEYARAAASRFAHKAQEVLAGQSMRASVHCEFLAGVVGFVVERER